MHLSRSLIFCLLVFVFSSCTRVAWKKNWKDSGLANAHTGVLIQDLQSGETIWSHQAEQYFMPASNVKLLTFLLSKRFLTDSIPYARVRETNDSLFFWGTGDPTFLRSGFQNSALLTYLAKQNKVFVYSDKLSDAKPLGEGWSWDDYNDDYSAEISQLPIYGNLISTQADSRGWNIQPRLFSQDTSTNAQLAEAFRNRSSNALELPLKTINVKKQQIPFLTSPKFTAQLLSDTLHKEVLWKPSDVDLTSKLLYANRLDSLLIPMLHNSDNHIAEQLLYLIAAQKSLAGPTQNIIKNLKKDAQEDFFQSIKWVDGSGLSRYNLFRPVDLVQILRLLHQEVGMEKLSYLLPESGKSGTLKNIRLEHQGAKIWAKSGSFSNTYNLSGFYQNTQGRIIVFSILTNLANQSVSKSKNAVITFLENSLK